VKAVAVSGAAGEDELAGGGEFEEGAAGKVGAGPVDPEGRGGGVHVPPQMEMERAFHR